MAKMMSKPQKPTTKKTGTIVKPIVIANWQKALAVLEKRALQFPQDAGIKTRIAHLKAHLTDQEVS